MERTKSTKSGNSSWSPPVVHPSRDSSFTCPRCQGLFARIFLMDLYDGSGENGSWALRCFQCGEIRDPLILKHRTLRPQPVNSGRPRIQSPVSLS